MVNGIKTFVDGEHCVYCNAKVNEKLYNFCPICGNALNVDAIKLKEQQIKKIKLELLDQLAYEINDKDALTVILNRTKSL
ncbi:MAG: hypothetical protein E7376_02600 [Clostridiales bacterium]|nr:hypothetical protein [Clostridiales bacterium]